MFDYQPFDVEDFSGGITDFYLDGPRNRAQRMDNFAITEDAGDGKRKLRMRDGRALYSTSQLPDGNTRPGALFRHPQPDVIVQVVNRLYYKSASWHALNGPLAGNPALGIGATVNNYASAGEWNQHLLIAIDSLQHPVKVYKDESDAWQVRTAALPGVDLESAIDVANDLRSKFNAHIADATQHTTAADGTNTVVTAAAWDETSLLALVTTLLTKYAAHEADAQLASAWLYHPAQRVGAAALASVVAPTTIDEAITRLADLKAKLNVHDADAVAHALGSLHQGTATPKPTITSGGGAASYLYRFNFAYSYMVADVTYVDRGPTIEVPITAADAAARAIANIPQIENGSNRCYDTASIICEISRTTDGGTEFYNCGSVVNGTSTFADTMTDATLQTQNQLYTNGGNLDRDPGPKCKYVIVVDKRAYYLHLKDGTSVFKNKYRQSNPGDIFVAPGSNDEEVDAEITGGSWVGQFPLVFCVDRAYRIEGEYDAQGRGVVRNQEIPGRKGSINHQGIVRIPGGVIFPSDDGFWFTDGYQVRPISKGLRETYKRLTSSSAKKARISGFYDSKYHRVAWQVQWSDHSGDCDTTLYCDLRQGISDDMPFYTASGGNLPGNWAVTSMCELNGEVLMSDKRGYVLKHDPTKRVDPKIDLTVAASSWVNATIFCDWKSVAFACGSQALRKASYQVVLKAANHGDAAYEIGVCKDDSGFFKSLKQVRSASAMMWGKPKILWGASGWKWGLSKLIQAVRNMPMKFLRWDYKQLRVSNAKTNIANSDTFGEGTLDATLGVKSLTLNVAGETFPLDSVDYFLAFDNDDYVKEYLVAAINGARTVLTYFDPLASSVSSATRRWVLRGYRKRDDLHVLALSFPVALLTSTQKPYRAGASETGANE